MLFLVGREGGVEVLFVFGTGACGGGGMVVLVRLVLSRLVDLSSLLEGVVVGLPVDFRVWWEGEDAL